MNLIDVTGCFVNTAQHELRRAILTAEMTEAWIRQLGSIQTWTYQVATASAKSEFLMMISSGQ